MSEGRPTEVRHPLTDGPHPRVGKLHKYSVRASPKPAMMRSANCARRSPGCTHFRQTRSYPQSLMAALIPW